jgi:predicted O-methyltransferase YrrM
MQIKEEWLAGPYLADPIRQVFMMGLIWRVAQELGARPMDILEIGSWHGASTLTWGEAIQLYHASGGSIGCIDLWKPFFDEAANQSALYRRLNALAETEQAMEDFRTNMKLMPVCITLKTMRGFSQDILPTLSGPYDIIYIDGDHAYSAVRRDLALAIPLIATGGVICGDDLEFQAHQIDAELTLADPNIDFAELPGTNRRFHPGVTMAVGETFGPVSAWLGFWAMRKTEAGWEQISLEGMPTAIPSFLSPRQRVKIQEFLLRTDL